MAEEKQATKKLARGVVARGNTVYAPHPTETVIKGTNPETFKPIMGSKIVEFGPGQEVTLPEEEILQLRKSGALVNPDKVEEPASEGTRAREVM